MQILKHVLGRGCGLFPNGTCRYAARASVEAVVRLITISHISALVHSKQPSAVSKNLPLIKRAGGFWEFASAKVANVLPTLNYFQMFDFGRLESLDRSGFISRAYLRTRRRRRSCQTAELARPRLFGWLHKRDSYVE